MSEKKAPSNPTTAKVDGMPDAATQVSRVGLWNNYYLAGDYDRQTYGDDITFVKGAQFLDHPEIQTVEDWGCGYGGMRLYLNPRQTYVGIDGSQSKFADLVRDLEKYQSQADGIFMRGVIDHNPNWHLLLDNAVASFRKRMVLVLFTPYQETTRVIREYPNWGETGISMWDIGFKRSDIVDRFVRCQWTSEENIPSRTGYGVEHMFFLER